MPSPRNSKFNEKFDDDDESDSSSSESLASAPSPTRPPDPIFSERLAEMFSGMLLRTAPRASDHHQRGTAMQAQTLTQAQTSGAVQDAGASTVAAETCSEKAEAGSDEQQEVRSEAALEQEKTTALIAKSGTGQHERHDSAHLTTAKTANIFLHQLFDEVLREQSITPEEMHHASKHIEANYKRLERDLECFAEQRLLISQSLQYWFVIHEHDSAWETKDPCQKCLMRFDRIDEIYFVACSNVRDMMTVLDEGLRASALLYESTRKSVTGQTQRQTFGEFCAPLLQMLESTEGMLQSLFDDAEERKGWPQASSSEQPSSMASRPKGQGQVKQLVSDAVKAEADARTSATKDSLINEAFGDGIWPLECFQEVLGCTDGEVCFAMNPNGDISAQQWSQSENQWFNIGQLSGSLGRIKGTLASHRLADELELRRQFISHNNLGYFKALAKQHEALTMKLAFGLEQLQACLNNVYVKRAGQEVVDAPVEESSTQSTPGPGGAVMVDEEQDTKSDGAKVKQMKSNKSKSKKQKKKKKGRR
ncbi:hypothetical protein QM012_003698 [Aureobasidium pullulans]|uniref:Uncharacterized protein n=1 Tax=Aureobasidium pullulans TaxID=5580 RepID=A0ABR0T7M9_AURPU